MLSKKLRDQYSNRRFLLWVVVVFMIGVGYVFTYRHRGIDLMDYLGLSEYVGRSFIDVMITMGVQDSINVLKSSFLLIITLFPGALFNASPALIAIVVIFWTASHFMRSLYDIEKWKEAYNMLDRNVFGMPEMKPQMIVKEGHIAIGEGSLFDRLGGRGLLIVYNDSAVVIERGGRLVRVEGPTLTFLDRFERVWGVVDLRVQRWPLTDNAMTKEGIPISCETIVTFKIDDRYTDENEEVRVKQPIETPAPEVTDREIAKELEKAGIAEPLPYTEEAVFKAATCNWIRIHQQDHPEQLRRWTGRVIIGGTEGTLRSILANYRLDWLLEPSQPRKYLFSVELDFDELGKLDRKQVPDELHKQFREHNEPLTLQAEVKVKQTGRSWVIVDDNKEYLVQKVNQALSVYFRKKHPREEIREKLEKKLQKSFKVKNSVGAKILKVELGEIKVRDMKDEEGENMELPDDVYDQWVDAWQADWERRAIEEQIEGEAELARLQAAQVQAQAEIVLTFIEAIRPLVNGKDELPSYLLAARFIETLHWMAYDPFKRAFMPPEIMRTLDELEIELKRVKSVGEMRSDTMDTTILGLEQLLQRRRR